MSTISNCSKVDGVGALPCACINCETKIARSFDGPELETVEQVSKSRKKGCLKKVWGTIVQFFWTVLSFFSRRAKTEEHPKVVTTLSRGMFESAGIAPPFNSETDSTAAATASSNSETDSIAAATPSAVSPDWENGFGLERLFEVDDVDVDGGEDVDEELEVDETNLFSFYKISSKDILYTATFLLICAVCV